MENERPQTVSLLGGFRRSARTRSWAVLDGRRSRVKQIDAYGFAFLWLHFAFCFSIFFAFPPM